MLSRLNHIHLHQDWGWFVGRVEQNEFHRHYAIQLSFSLGSDFEIITESQTFKVKNGIHIPSNIRHRIKSEIPTLVVLINPNSTFGHYWHTRNNKNPEIIDEMWAMFMRFNDRLILDGISGDEIIESIENTIKKYVCDCTHFYHQNDERIAIALEYLENQFPRVVPLSEVAEVCAISESRFLHLFKEATGQTYRRAQLWVKIQKSISLFGQMNLTEIAHECGFSDSAHFSRTFKETFGLSPSDLIKSSQFIQS